MNVKIKNIPKLHLTDLLKRRKTTFKSFVESSGVQSYDALCHLCSGILGVIPPDEEMYRKHFPIVSSPIDGIVVLEPIITNSDDVSEETALVSELIPGKKGRKKKIENNNG